MKKILISILALIILIGCGGNKTENAQAHKPSSADPADKMTENETLIYYTCPMEEHRDEFSDVPGKCSKCGMALAAGVMTDEGNHDFYGCPMLIHSHIHEVKPGKCVDCGMNLKPMRLIK